MRPIDNPDIKRVERLGYLVEPKPWTCPVCGAELHGGERVWYENGRIVVCECCLDGLQCDDAIDYFEQWRS